MPWSADVVIVGSGVAGSLVAARLAAKGVKVLILEAGPRVERSEEGGDKAHRRIVRRTRGPLFRASTWAKPGR